MFALQKTVGGTDMTPATISFAPNLFVSTATGLQCMLLHRIPDQDVPSSVGTALNPDPSPQGGALPL